MQSKPCPHIWKEVHIKTAFEHSTVVCKCDGMTEANFIGDDCPVYLTVEILMLFVVDPTHLC